MRITDEALDEFIAIYKDEFGEDIDRKEASAMACRVLTLYELLARKLPDEKNLPTGTTEHDDDHPRIGFRTYPPAS